MSDLVTNERLDAVLMLRLNRPDKLNALNEEMTAALIAGLEAAATDSRVRVIVLAGTGRGFSAGQDLEAFVKMKQTSGPVSVADHLRKGYNVVARRIREIEKPVVASLNGIAAGVGLSLALCCDVRIAADDALLTLGFSKIGLIPDGGGSLMLPALVGLGRALELAWTSDRIGAQEALAIGLVNRVVPAGRLAEETAAYAARFAEMSPIALALTKRAFNRSVIPNFVQWLEEEAVLQDLAANGPDLLEGVRSFLEKRKPAFATP